jgi:hypothetical protein
MPVTGYLIRFFFCFVLSIYVVVFGDLGGFFCLPTPFPPFVSQDAQSFVTDVDPAMSYEA